MALSRRNTIPALSPIKQRSRFQKGLIRFKGELFYQCMALMGLAFLIIFAYLPMYGITMAFQDFDPSKGFFKSTWVGLYNFKDLLTDDAFWKAAGNTVVLSVVKFSINFISPLLFALLLNELKGTAFKRIVQTASYLPYFISWVIAAGLVTLILSAGSDGIINPLFIILGIIKEPIAFLTYPEYFLPISVLIDLWKFTGFGAIIYLAAISTIDQEVYEASVVDGANRFQRVFVVTLPMIRDTIIVLLILGVGSIFSGGLGSSNFNLAYLLGNSLTMKTSDVLDTYVLRMGLQLGRYSFASAAGLMQSVLSLFMIVGVNAVVRKIDGEGLF